MAERHPPEEYTPIDRPFTPAIGNADTLEAIGDYSDRFMEGARTVLHEVASDLIHLDVHICPPSPRRDCYTLITSGMSDRPMPKAAEWGSPPYAELMLRLPSNWPMPADFDVVTDWHTDATWPIGVLKQAARMPHDCGSALGFGHTIAFTNPPGPLHPGVRFNAALLLPTVWPPQAGEPITTRDGRTIHIYVLHLLLPDELEFKRANGIDPLLDLFDAAKLGETVDVNRPSVLRHLAQPTGTSPSPLAPTPPPAQPKKWWRFGL